MSEELYINKLTGKDKRSVFTVPQGYFEQLGRQVMSRLPQEEQAKPTPVKVYRLRPWLYAAVFAGVVALSVTLFQNRPEEDSQLVDNFSESYVDEAADYAMVDNQDIYAYLLADF